MSVISRSMPAHRNLLSRAVLTTLAATVPALLISCASDPAGTAGPSAATPGSVTGSPRTQNPPAAGAGIASSTADTPYTTEPWLYDRDPGSIIRTEHYRIFTTQQDQVQLRRLPGFVEEGLRQYRSAFAKLPGPPIKLDTYFMGTRAQWARITTQLMGAEAPTFLRIQRGGYASAGVGVYYDIGTADTMSIAAHEGWHQYTQRTFKEPLPIWLEEGLATYMEGHRWDGPSVRFLPWSNAERFDQLRLAASRNELFTLEELMSTSPQELLEPPSFPMPASMSKPGSNAGAGADVAANPPSKQRPKDAALTYYAQLWALVHFLREGQDAKYRFALGSAVSDAAEGRLRSTIANKLGERSGGMLASRRGPALFLAYFNNDLSAAEAEYAQFIQQIVRVGGREAAIAGESPAAQR